MLDDSSGFLLNSNVPEKITALGPSVRTVLHTPESCYCSYFPAAVGSECDRAQQPDSTEGQRDPEQRGQVSPEIASIGFM